MIIKEKRLAYLAGLVDGDGSFSIRYDEKAGYQFTMSVYNTHRPLMKFLVQQFGGQFRKLPTEGNRKVRYQWYAGSKEIVYQLAPYLFLKQNQANLAIEFLKISGNDPINRNRIMEDIKKENNKVFPVEKLYAEHITKQPEKKDYAYLAGFFDAEGSFSIHKRNNYVGNGLYTSVARVSNTDQRLFPWLISTFGGYMLTNKRKEGHKDEGVWHMSSKTNREKQILAILPYLIVKRERAILYLEWIRNCRKMTPEEKDNIFTKISELNVRGISPETICKVPEEIPVKI